MASSQIKVNPVENIRRTVLVVDDEEINRLILTNLLKTDYNIVTATDGIEALKILRSGKRIAAVLLDLKIPNMSVPAQASVTIIFSGCRNASDFALDELAGAGSQVGDVADPGDILPENLAG